MFILSILIISNKLFNSLNCISVNTGFLKSNLSKSSLNLYLINSFDDVIDKEARDNLKDIDAGKKEFVPAGTTATGPVDKGIQDKNDPIPLKDGAESELEYIENLSKKEIIAGLRIHYFLIH